MENGETPCTAEEIIHPLVSVVVAVYNREATLDRCIDSLVYQTYQNVEIVLVNNMSTDRSMEIMKKWQALFPDKIRILENEKRGAAPTKNVGIRSASGDYITLVDSDDYIDYRLIQLLVEKIDGDSDIVFSRVYKKTGQTKRTLPGPSTKYPADDRRNYLLCDYFYLPGKLFRKGIFDEYGVLPELIIGEDVSWLFPVLAKVGRITYTPFAGYYYEVGEDSLSAVQNSIEHVRDILKGNERILANTPEEYQEYARLYCMKRALSLGQKHPGYYPDVMNALIADLPIYVESDLVQEFGKNQLDRIERFMESDKIPKTVYVCNFGHSGESCADRSEVLTGGEVVVLDETNCDVSILPIIQSAYSAGEYAFVGKYFAVKACYEKGGIFVDEKLIVEQPFDELLYQSAFFGFDSNSSFSDRAFGCIPGNFCFEKILKTYEVDGLYSDPYAPLSSRIKTVLVGALNAPLQFAEYSFVFGSSTIRIYSVEMFVFAIEKAKNRHLAHYAEYDGYVIPEIVHNLYERKERQSMVAEKAEVARVKRQLSDARTLSAKRSRYITKLEAERTRTYGSLSWRLTKPLRYASGILRNILGPLSVRSR